MKPFNPIFMSVVAFRKSFPHSAAHFSASATESVERRKLILIQMPKAGVVLHGISDIIQGADSEVHTLEIRRSIGGKDEHLCTFSAVHITHPQPCVILDTVRFGNPSVEADITGQADNELQEIHFHRALRFAQFFNDATALLGKKPEERVSLSETTRQQMSAMMDTLRLPITALLDLIEQSKLPNNIPRKGDVNITQLPNALDVESFIEPSDLVEGANAGTVPTVEVPAAAPPVSRPVQSLPVSEGGRGVVVTNVPFGKPRLTPGGGKN